MSKQTEALKLALEALEIAAEGGGVNFYAYVKDIREALASEALDRMAENARELGLDYEPPCKTGSQCTSKCQQCEQPAQQQEPVHVPVTDNTYNYAKSLAEAIFKQHFASDEHYASGRVVWGVNDTVIGILTQIDNMVADMVRRPAQHQEPVAVYVGETWCGSVVRLYEDLPLETPLYTSPQSKPWVGLTMADKKEIERVAVYVDGAIRLAEAKLREKNT